MPNPEPETKPASSSEFGFFGTIKRTFGLGDSEDDLKTRIVSLNGV
jgi:hypothetical protein